MPCLIELGKAGRGVHRRIGEKIAEVCVFAVITTKDYFPELREAALKSGMNENKIIFSSKPEDIFAKLKETAPKGGIILLESRVPQKLVDLLKK